MTADAERWLTDAVHRVSADPTAVRTLFPAVGRHTGRGDAEDAARAELLAALPLRGEELAAEVAALYRYGDAAEKRGVLHALHRLDLADRALPLVRDALRTNDTRLVAAALGRYAADHLDAAAYRQAVLKCVFVGVPLDRVAGLDRRADEELARMLVDFAEERVAAGRDVPTDVWRVVDRFPGVVAASGLTDQLESPVPARREAAARALDGRTPSVGEA